MTDKPRRATMETPLKHELGVDPLKHKEGDPFRCQGCHNMTAAELGGLCENCVGDVANRVVEEREAA